MKQIQLETERDDNLQALKQIIMHGWPDQKSDVPPNLIPYYGMRDELTTQNGLVFKGEQIVTPLLSLINCSTEYIETFSVTER